MYLVVRASLALSGFVAQALFAGGTSVPVRVLEVNASSRERQTVRLAPAAADPSVFPGSCASVTLVVAYRRSHWWRATGTPSTPAQHAEALRVLSVAQQVGSAVQFGVMGQGLSATPGSPCQFSSHGLQVISENPSVPVVYSFFKWP